jgi:hypothetical protein
LAQKVSDLYLQGMDSTLRNQQGNRPVEMMLAQIYQMPRNSFEAMMADLHTGIAAPFFDSGVMADLMNSDQNLLYLTAGSLGMGDRDYYLLEKNAELKARVERGELPESALEDPYKPFYVMLMALVKIIHLRPGLNRFVSNMKLYQKDDVSIGFTVKKKFADNAAEGLAFESFGPETTMDILYEKIVKEINAVKDENTLDNSVDVMDKFMKLPPFILRPVFRFIRFLDRHGRVPYDFVKKDPNYASAFITNLGSIHLKSGYHHLSNWGTTSLFVIIGERKMKPFFDEKGNVTMKMVNDIGLTIDERIADGFYYAKSVRLLKKLAAEPELLDLRADEEVEY